MTIEIERDLEKSSLVQPKSRMSGKKSLSGSSHMDHIIVLQGVPNLSTGKISSLAVGVIEHHKNMENVYSHSNGMKHHTITDLPVIPDDDDEKSELSPTHKEENSAIERPQTLSKDGSHHTSNIYNSKEIIDLSPIYENSADAYSNHDDIHIDVLEEFESNNKLLAEDTNESNLTTPNSLSHSEASLETGLLSEVQCTKKKKKKVNINDQNEDLIEIETGGLKCDSEISSPDKSVLSNSCGDGYLTMTGTIKRGKKKGHNVDVKLNISREELEVMEAAIVAKEMNKAQQWVSCTPTVGFHIVLWSVLCIPFVFVISTVYSFYIGTITWYNVFTYISECKNLWKRVFISPFVILLYPFLIIIFTLGVGFYAAIIQVTCCGSSWWNEVCDLEKGFYGWFCGALHLSDCSPYEVVILTDLKVVENTDMRGHSSTEDISM